MNRRSFFARCLSGAVLGLARVLPMPTNPAVPKWRRLVGDYMLIDGKVVSDLEQERRNRHFNGIIMDDIMSDTTSLDRAEIKGWFDKIKMRPGSKMIIFGTPCEPS